jgi:hypothetical protein
MSYNSGARSNSTDAADNLRADTEVQVAAIVACRLLKVNLWPTGRKAKYIGGIARIRCRPSTEQRRATLVLRAADDDGVGVIQAYIDTDRHLISLAGWGYGSDREHAREGPPKFGNRYWLFNKMRPMSSFLTDILGRDPTPAQGALL